jgi:large subunit ribosomal protein L4
MYKARYYKADGKKGRARALPTSLFDGVVNEGVLHQVVKAHLANQRQGTASAKTRSEVSGGNKKPFRQKGTGRARQGTTRAAHMVGGGRAFPPIPHSWRLDVNRKVKALARRSAFNARAAGERVVLIDPLPMEAPSTGGLRRFLASIELGGAKVLMLTDGLRTPVYLSGRNLPRVKVEVFGNESVYDILWADVVVIERGALDSVEATAGEEAEAEGSSDA